MSADPVKPDLPLRLTRAEKIAEGIHLFELRHPAGSELPPFTAGAHIQLRVPNGLIRKYSLCNDPAERDRYRVAVKREDTGRGGSISLIDEREARRRIDGVGRRSTISDCRNAATISSSSPAASASRRSCR